MQFRRWDSVGSVELTFPPTEAPDPALWIQFGLSLANLSTNCTVPAGTAGRPERPRGYVHRRRTGFRCQRSNVAAPRRADVEPPSTPDG
jgi:hypothetical protein